MPRHSHPKRPHRWVSRLLATLLFAVAVLPFTMFSGKVVAHQLDSNIVSVDTTPLLGADRPPALVLPDVPHQPINVLLIGSDSRKGTKIGGATPGLSDTTILLHISADRSRVTGVSIPRDSMVQRPDCVAKDGKTQIPATFGMFNAAFSQGGVACTQRTVEQLTGIRIDNFMVVNLAGFQNMIDVVGGVPICVPQPVNDDIGRIYLKAGSYVANGKQALGYARERHTMSPNGDLGRMKRQQALLAALSHKMLSAGVLANPLKVYRLLSEATNSLTADPVFASTEYLAGLAIQLRNIDPDKVRFFSVPTRAYEPDPNRLEWTEDADRIWDAFRADTPIPVDLRKDMLRASAVTPGAGTGDHKTREADSNGLCV